MAQQLIPGVLDQEVNDRYAIYCADSMDVMASMPDNSIDASIYSPPFAGLYVYSSNDRDVSNARNYKEFREHYGMFVESLGRLTKPGRLTAVHAAAIPSGNSGRDSYFDFPGDVIRLHEEHGWDWVSRHVIWKEPLAVRNRTMAKNLAHKTLVTDAGHAGVAAADELLLFRRPGGTEPIVHPTGLDYYAGEESVPAEYLKYKGHKGNQIENRYSHWIWRRYASSVWDDIRLGRVLPFRDSRDEDDEKHVHPLQLDVIERFIQMRTVPGEVVFTPFMGVGSEVFAAVQLGRLGVGAELKPSYYRQAVKNLEAVDSDRYDEATLFDELGDQL
jgi:hypothetical protein